MPSVPTGSYFVPLLRSLLQQTDHARAKGQRASHVPARNALQRCPPCFRQTTKVQGHVAVLFFFEQRPSFSLLWYTRSCSPAPALASCRWRPAIGTAVCRLNASWTCKPCQVGRMNRPQGSVLDSTQVASAHHRQIGPTCSGAAAKARIGAGYTHP